MGDQCKGNVRPTVSVANRESSCRSPICNVAVPSSFACRHLAILRQSSVSIVPVVCGVMYSLWH